MTNQTLADLKQTKPVRKHRAVYHAVSKQLWSVYQKRVLKFWDNERALKARQVFAKRYYLPLLKPLVENRADDISILEVGSGPVCVSQYLEKGEVTYIDPLIDEYRKIFPGIMPEKAIYIAEMAEKYEWGEQTFDMVVCLYTLSDVHNPELILNKTSQVLKDDGVFAVSIDVWPSWLARLHFFLSRFVPVLPQFNRLYSYTYQGFTNTLKRHFEIQDEQQVKPSFSWLFLRKEIFFVCKHKKL